MAEALEVPPVSKKVIPHQFRFIRNEENKELRQQIKDFFDGKDTGDERDSSDPNKRVVKVLYDIGEEKKGLQLTTMLHNPGPKAKGYRDSVNPAFLRNPKLTILFTMDDDYHFAEQCTAFSRDLLCVQTECLITKEGLIHRLRFGSRDNHLLYLRIQSCLHIPESKTIKIKTDYLENICTETQIFVDNLYPGEDVGKSTLILIGGSRLARKNNRETNYGYQDVMDKIINQIKERFIKNYNVWGGELPICYSTKDLDKDGNCKDDNFDGIFGCNIYGPDVDSYSLILESDLTLDEVNLKISSFKENIKFQKYSIGFVNLCRDEGQKEFYSECFDTLRRQFSDTKFTALLQLRRNRGKRIIGMDSEFNDEYHPNPVIGTSILMSVLIITFNDTEVQEPTTEDEFVVIDGHETYDFVYEEDFLYEEDLRG